MSWQLGWRCWCLWLPPLHVPGPQGGAPIAHFQARWLGCSVMCILKRGNGCPGILQGEDKVTEEWSFCWKMCFAYNCNKHHLWLLIRTNSLLVLWDLSVLFPWQMLHWPHFAWITSHCYCAVQLTNWCPPKHHWGQKASSWNYFQKLFIGKRKSGMKLYK